jgi:hypothetical protein
MTSPWESDGERLRCQLPAHTTDSDGELNAVRLGMNWRGRVTERDADGAILAARLERPEFHS